MGRKFDIDKDTLVDLYINQNMRREEVAEHFGCSDALIKLRLREYQISKPFELECANKERQEQIACANCGDLFSVARFRSDGKWQAKFCSPTCSSESRYLGEDHKRAKRREVQARRRSRLKDASVDLTEDEKDAIFRIYAECPDGYEVDHIVPISKGGKHHPNNLQYLTITENRRKWNKLDYE